MTSRIDIVLKEQMVFVIVNLGRSSQVSRLESTLKDECLVFRVLASVESVDVHFDELFLIRVFLVLVLGVRRNLRVLEQFLNVE